MKAAKLCKWLLFSPQITSHAQRKWVSLNYHEDFQSLTLWLMDVLQNRTFYVPWRLCILSCVSVKQKFINKSNNAYLWICEKHAQDKGKFLNGRCTANANNRSQNRYICLTLDYSRRNLGRRIAICKVLRNARASQSTFKTEHVALEVYAELCGIFYKQQTIRRFVFKCTESAYRRQISGWSTMVDVEIWPGSPDVKMLTIDKTPGWRDEEWWGYENWKEISEAHAVNHSLWVSASHLTIIKCHKNAKGSRGMVLRICRTIWWIWLYETFCTEWILNSEDCWLQSYGPGGKLE